jgi:hypothetical protein
MIKIASRAFIWTLGQVFLALMWVGEKLEELDTYYDKEE